MKLNSTLGRQKTHFLTLEFQPGDTVWAILASESSAQAVKTQIARVIHTIEAKKGPDGKLLPHFEKCLYYQLEDGSTIMEPLRTKEEAEALIHKGNKLVNEIKSR